MPFAVKNRAALKKNGAAPAGSCGQIMKDYGDGTHYDLLVTTTPPPECERRKSPILAAYVEVRPCGCLTRQGSDTADVPGDKSTPFSPTKGKDPVQELAETGLKCSLQIAAETMTPKVGHSRSEGRIDFVVPKGGTFVGSGTSKLVDYPKRFSSGRDEASIAESSGFVETPLALAGRRDGDTIHVRVSWGSRMAKLGFKFSFLDRALKIPLFLNAGEHKFSMLIRDGERHEVAVKFPKHRAARVYYTLRIALVSALKEALKTCSVTADLLEQAASVYSGREPKIEMADHGETMYKEEAIRLDGGRTWCALILQFIQELCNTARRRTVDELIEEAARGEVGRDEFVERLERMEFEGGLRLRAQARRACAAVWGCPDVPFPEWLETEDFQYYYASLKGFVPEHLKGYEDFWEKQFRQIFEQRHRLK